MEEVSNLYIISDFTYAAEYEYLVIFQFRNPFGGVSSVVHKFLYRFMVVSGLQYAKHSFLEVRP